MKLNFAAAKKAHEDSKTMPVLAPGWYDAKVLEVKEEKSQGGTLGLSVKMRLKTGLADRPKQVLTSRIWYEKASGEEIPFGLGRMYNLVEQSGIEYDADGNFDIEDLEGATLSVRLSVQDEKTYTANDGSPRKQPRRNEVAEYKAGATETDKTSKGSKTPNPEDIPF